MFFVHLVPVHGTRSPILNFSWAEPHMKLVTACRDGTSKLCSLLPWGTLQQERVYNCNSSVTSVMFYPGSSGMSLLINLCVHEIIMLTKVVKEI